MRLLSNSEFAARLASPNTDTALASSELLVDGKPTGVIVDGAILEAAVDWHGCRIAFFTDDIPFEDMLRIYMFDANLALLDAAVLGGMYSTGTFTDLHLQAPNTLTFRFFAGTVWRAVLLTEREFSIPFLSDPRGVSRTFKFFRHFRIEGEPQPESLPGAFDSAETARRQLAPSASRRASRKS